MKRSAVLCLSLLFVLLSNIAFAQAQFAVSNIYGVDAPVYDAQGNPLEGPGFLAELWGGAQSDSLAPVVNIGLGYRREIVPFLTDGYFNSPWTQNVVLAVQPYDYAWLQVHAWDARLGGAYEDVKALGIGGYGESLLFYAQGTSPLGLPADLPAPLIGLESFSLLPIVPEPGASLMLLLGLPFLLSRRLRPH